MNKSRWHALACGAAMGVAAAMPASAATATFEDVAPNIFITGDSFTSGEFSFATDGFFGTVDTAAGSFFQPPTGSDGQYYSGFNDSSVAMTATAGGFVQLSGLDFAFVGSSLGAGSPGRLVAQGIDGSGGVHVESWDFGAANSSGEFAFMSLGAGDLGAFSSRMVSVSFAACLYVGGVCSTNPQQTQNLAQFAIDNIRADVPEPASLALVLVALGVAGAATRRRQSN